MIQAYLTAYYAREWGNLIGQGLSCLRFFSMMQEQKIPAFSRNRKGLALSLDRGQSFFRDGQGVYFFKKRIAPYD